MPVIINGTTGIDTVQDGIVTDAKLNLTANSQEIKDALNAGGSAPIYACRAWVNFNGTGALTGTYSQSAFAITVSVTSHGLSQGQTVNITFQTGTASQEAFTVTSVTNANQFVVTSVTSRTTSGNCTLATIIRGSGNVASITDNGVGDYTVVIDNDMPDANYSVVANSSNGGQGTSDEYSGISMYGTNSYLAGSVRIGCVRWRYDTQVMLDSPIVSVSIFR